MNLERKGKILIQKEILKDEIRRFIKKEKEFSEKYKVKIIYVEKYNNKNFNYEKETVIINHDIKISGIPDRIDYLVDKNLFRIIDYKSSFTKSDKMMFEELYEMMENENNEEKNNKYNKLIQLLTYIYYAVQTDKNIKGKITGAILPLRDTDYDNKKTFDSYNKYIKSSEMNSEEINIKCFESIDEIEKLFKKLFNNIIFNKQKNFVQTDNSYTCRYCSYNSICKIKDL
jgi:ATP-dependent helicase/DNAse subunit B